MRYLPVVLLLLCVVGCAPSEKQVRENQFRSGAKAFVAKAKEAVAAWPNNPDRFLQLSDELELDNENLPIVADNPTLFALRQEIRRIGINLLTAKWIINGFDTRDIESKRREADEDMRRVNGIIEFIEKQLSQ